jgi:hypothetical protein
MYTMINERALRVSERIEVYKRRIVGKSLQQIVVKFGISNEVFERYIVNYKIQVNQKI